MKYKLFIVVFFVISLALGMSVFFNSQGISSSKQELVDKPKISVDGKLNSSFTKELSDYLTQSTAYHDKIISVNAFLTGKLFKTSSEPQVTVGKNGMLYFNATTEDYLGINTLSDRELFNVCDTLSQMERYCKSNSVSFAFTVAPNKNTLYSEDMPERYVKVGPSNLERLTPMLKKSGVNYVDLRQEFSKLDERYYYKNDTHWNNEGAVIGYESIMSSLYDDYLSFEGVEFNKSSKHSGDLSEMLYPDFEIYETEKTLDYNFSYATVGRFKSAEDIIIRTVSPVGKHSLLMFRDSFGIALFPLMAEGFQSTYYSRQVPVDLTLAKINGSDTVIYEIVERNLKNILLYSPVFESERVLPSAVLNCEYELSTKENGNLIQFYGKVNSKLDVNRKIFLLVLDAEGNSAYYNTTGTFTGDDSAKYTDSCFSAFVEKAKLPENYTVKIVLGG